jgi:hypothetical protein
MTEIKKSVIERLPIHRSRRFSGALWFLADNRVPHHRSGVLRFALVHGDVFFRYSPLPFLLPGPL